MTHITNVGKIDIFKRSFVLVLLMEQFFLKKFFSRICKLRIKKTMHNEPLMTHIYVT